MFIAEKKSGIYWKKSEEVVYKFNKAPKMELY